MKDDKKYDKEEPTPEVLEAVKKAAAEGRLNCPQARALAKEIGVPYFLVGRAADILGIKITDCSLGCFK